MGFFSRSIRRRSVQRLRCVTSVLLSATVSPVSATSCMGSPRSDSSSSRVGGGDAFANRSKVPRLSKCRAEGRVRRGSQPPRFSDGRLPSPVVTAAPADRPASPSALRLSPAVLTARCHATQITPYPLRAPPPKKKKARKRGEMRVAEGNGEAARKGPREAEAAMKIKTRHFWVKEPRHRRPSQHH